MRRLDETLDVRSYDPGAGVDRGARDVLVVLVDGYTPPLLRERGTLGATQASTCTTYVFTQAVERLTREPRGSFRFQVAVARVVLHEVEHVRRQSAAHDPGGWFTAAVTPEFLTAHGVGPFRKKVQ